MCAWCLLMFLIFQAFQRSICEEERGEVRRAAEAAAAVCPTSLPMRRAAEELQIITSPSPSRYLWLQLM